MDYQSESDAQGDSVPSEIRCMVFVAVGRELESISQCGPDDVRRKEKWMSLSRIVDNSHLGRRPVRFALGSLDI
jgi:hypothetical protein